MMAKSTKMSTINHESNIYFTNVILVAKQNQQKVV